MNDNKNNDQSNKPTTYKLAKVSEKGSVKQWFVNLFKGWWYGMTDLFLMSWGNIVLLIFLLFVPLTYAVVCALGYWNPVDNLGKVELPIFDADRTFIKVEDKTDGVYRMGALAVDENTKEQFIDINPVDKDNKPNVDYGKIIKNYSINELNEKINNIKDGDKLVLNNGLTITYKKGETTVTAMDSWESLKQSGILIKTNSKKSDENAKFEVAAAPNEELRFRNIRYISDKDDNNTDWKTGKYQMQIKLNNGYGAALLGLQGIAYNTKFKDDLANGTIDKNVALPLINANQKGLLPNTDIFQTYQRNFVSAYILSQVSEFATGIVNEMSPVLNAVKDNAAANVTFGTKGQDIIDYLDQIKQQMPVDKIQTVVNKIESKLNSNNYYLVLSKEEFTKAIGGLAPTADKTNFDSKTLLGTDGSNGTIAKWLNDVELFANNTGFNALNADQGSTLSFVKQIVDKVGGKDKFAQGIAGLLNSPASLTNGEIIKDSPEAQELIKSLLEVLAPLYGQDAQKIISNVSNFKTDPIFNKDENKKPTLNPFVPMSNKLSLFGILSDITAKNEKAFFPFLKSFTDMGMPVTVNLLGTTFGAMNKLQAANGVDPSKLTNIETSRGASMGIFGIGLGQMFIFLGIFIGYTMLRAALKRNKQYGKLTPRNWYLSKMLQYAVIGLIQTTITAWVIYAAGWNQYISATAMTYEWLWLLMTTMVMMSIICGLQYAMDPSLGAVLSIFYLAFNITCSGASYPGWMESGFYRGVTWVMPFTYFMEGSDQILYGVNNIGTNHFSTMRILTLWGYSTCFFAFFFLIGLYGAGSSYKVSCYGSKHGNRVYDALDALQRTELMDKFRIPYTNKKGETKFKYDWNILVGPFDGELYTTTKKLKKKSKSFKWYRELRVKRKMEEQEDWLNR